MSTSEPDEDSWRNIQDEAITHLEAGELAKAEELATAAATMPLHERARLLGDVAAAVLEKGNEPSFLRDAYRAHLELADKRFANGRTRGAAESFARAAQLAFDRNVHFDSLTSPLARDPRVFLRPLEESSVARALRAARGRSQGRPARGPGRAGRGAEIVDRTRVVVATRGNANFLGEILDVLSDDPWIDHTFVDFAGDGHFSRGIRNTAQVAEAILNRDSDMASRVEQRLRPLLQRADVLFVEWCTALAVLVGLVDPGDTRVVVRLHSYEVFTHWPHLLDFSRIDELVFVSEHLRDFAVDAIPALREGGAPRLHVLPLAKELKAYARPKVADARFTVGLIGWSSVAKDPAWALDVITRLRAHDDRYRLLLVGADLDDQVGPAAERYASNMSEHLAVLEHAGAVLRFGQTNDVASVLCAIGVILSSSVRESFHAGLVEGAASGAVPVVRDWPFFAGRQTSARTLFPADWVVESPDEAVARILATTQDETGWHDAGAKASAHALATWDWEVTRPDYQRLFRGA